jgi:predicted transcriptional regulator
MRAYQQWDEINKYFALLSNRNKETDKIAKDLYITYTSLEN